MVAILQVSGRILILIEVGHRRSVSPDKVNDQRVCKVNEYAGLPRH